MSAKATPSPPQGPVDPSEERFPEGNCRYLLPQVELRGQRCGCVHFTLNRSIPSATCVCGHASCFHTTEPYLPELEHLKSKMKSLESAMDRDFIEHLRAKLESLETQLDRDSDEKMSLRARVSTLEETVEKKSEEASLEIKGTYQNLSRAWNQISELERQARETQLRFRHQDEQLEGIRAETRRLEDRQLELNDADISLEERVEALEEMDVVSSPILTRSRPRVSSLSPDASTPSGNGSTETGRVSRVASVVALAPLTVNTTWQQTGNVLQSSSSSADGSNLWTVHISLLPTAEQPFPFEKDTIAYKRCLSRGLHQMVVIDGYDAESVVSCVNRAFGSILRGRAWIPLQAELCNAQTLQGLPMLRMLDEFMLHGRYDADFLRQHCAVCDPNGKMDSLYIAMRSDKLHWPALRNSPAFMPGLESCWAYNHSLDKYDQDDSLDESNRPSAGDILPTAFTSLKRGASEISRSSSFGASTAPGGTAGPSAATSAPTDGEGSRTKVPRVLPNIVDGRRRIETV